MRQHVTIIAEAGVNHNGDVALAERLVDAAADAGVDAVKFQTFTAELLTTRAAPKTVYQQEATGAEESQQNMLRRLELKPEHHAPLMERCRKRGIAFLSTPFAIPNIDFLAALGLQIFKVGSGEMTNLPYLRHLGRLGKRVILSTGMSSLDEVRAALGILIAAGTPQERITVLHCTSHYPAAFADVHLRAMQTMRDTLGVAVGYSDHTPGIAVPIAAVACGATVIEKHFTLDRTLPGPDHRASLEPPALAAMVRAIRHVEAALGSPEKQIQPAEEDTRDVARKSIVAARPIRAGEFFTEENLTTKRPGTGMSPMHWDRIIGTRAPKDFPADALIVLPNDPDVRAPARAARSSGNEA